MLLLFFNILTLKIFTLEINQKKAKETKVYYIIF